MPGPMLPPTTPTPTTDDSGLFRVPAPPPAPPRKVAYVYDETLAKCTDNIGHIRERGQMVHELIRCYGLLKLMEHKESRPASKEELLQFHSQDYVDFLFDVGVNKGGLSSCNTDSEGDDEEGEGDNRNNSGGGSFSSSYGISLNGSFNEESLEEFGLGYDCPVFRNLGEFALRIAGGTLTAAEALMEGNEVAINWCGGWHHAQRSEASGFCYVNDIVLGIHRLQKRFKYILYVDLDAHHGDGVENAFAFSDKVMTLSFHHFEAGYFPGTGGSTEVGKGKGKYFSLNVPLKAGLNDKQFKFLFDSIMPSVVRDFKPEAMVVQCGADCLSRDPLGAFNLTTDSITHCVRTVLTLTSDTGETIPTLLLGGGGYNTANASRLWTSLTAEALNRKLNNDIPDNMYFLKYGSDFELATQPSLRKNENDDEYINEIIEASLVFLLSLRKRKDSSNSVS